MEAIDITHVIAKLNQLTNYSFRLSGNYEQLRINDLPCFEINWINDVEDALSLLPEQRNSRQICVFDKIAPTQGEKLATAGINYIDLAGNAQIAALGLYIFISGQRHRADKKARPFNTAHLQSGKAFQASGLRVAYMLLTDPALLHLSFREIAQLANVSLGTVSAAMNDLSSQNLLDKETRQVLNRQALVERWVQAYPYLLRNTLAIGRFTSNDAFFMSL